MNNRFKLIKAWRGDHHRFYTDNQTGRIAVADQSVFDNPARIDYGPEHSDDGILYLDFMREAERVFCKGRELFHVPVVDERWKQYYILSDTVEMFYLMETFGMKYVNAGVKGAA